MSALLVVCLVETVVIGIVATLGFWALNNVIDRAFTLGKEEGRENEKAAYLARARSRGWRYQIDIHDLGDGAVSEGVRWRWEITDADADLVVGPQDGNPYAFGNAATRIDAELQALLAVERLVHPVAIVMADDNPLMKIDGVIMRSGDRYRSPHPPPDPGTYVMEPRVPPSEPSGMSPRE